METKHTPGPWKQNGLHSQVTTNHDINDDSYKSICLLSINEHNDTFGYDEYDANGKLIAAAPELLEALQLIIEEIEEENDKNTLLSIFSYTQAKSAIKKATE